MKAIVFDQAGKPEQVLALKEIPIPEPGENEVRVRLLASPINPADILFIAGRYRIQPSFPQVAGLEGAGIVDKCGNGVKLLKGVLVAFRNRNVWAEFVIVPVAKITQLPFDFPIEKACQFSLNPVTAYALLSEANVSGKEWLLLTAGNSAVSKMIIQMAGLRNLKVISISRSERDFAELKSLGATATLTDDIENISKSVQEITNGKGVKCVLDSIGGKLITELIKNLAPFGKLVSYGVISSENVDYHNSNLVFKNITIKGFGVDAWLSDLAAEKRTETFDHLISMLENPLFQMPVAARYRFEEFRSAIVDFANAKSGKVVFIPDEQKHVL